MSLLFYSAFPTGAQFGTLVAPVKLKNRKDFQELRALRAMQCDTAITCAQLFHEAKLLSLYNRRLTSLMSKIKQGTPPPQIICVKCLHRTILSIVYERFRFTQVQYSAFLWVPADVEINRKLTGCQESSNCYNRQEKRLFKNRALVRHSTTDRHERITQIAFTFHWYDLSTKERTDFSHQSVLYILPFLTRIPFSC